MALKEFTAFFLMITFVLHGIAFTIFAVRRRRPYYFFLTGTFSFLTALYFLKFERLVIEVPGAGYPLTWLLRAGALLCTSFYLSVIYDLEGSWLWKLGQRLRGRNSRAGGA